MNFLLEIWRFLLAFFFGKPSPYGTIQVEELPSKLRQKTVYLVGEGRHKWIAAMICPCGCGGIIQLNLMPRERPRWELTEHSEGTVSLHPSIRRIRGCKAHFWLKRGNVIWCDKESPISRRRLENDQRKRSTENWA